MAVSGDCETVDQSALLTDAVWHHQVEDTGAPRTPAALPVEPAGSDLLEIHRRLRVTEVGPKADIGAVVEETRESIDVEIERLGGYDPTAHSALEELTDRQREVLDTAIEEGYDDVPRAATYDDIATSLGSTPAAVGQHLRRIESRVMDSVAGSTQLEGD